MTEIFNLKVGDLFIYKGTVYEIIAKSKWTSLCGYLNDKYPTIVFYINVMNKQI